VNAIWEPVRTIDGLAQSRQAAGTETRKFRLTQDAADIEGRIGHGTDYPAGILPRDTFDDADGVCQ
jgi:hypothetical protein